MKNNITERPEVNGRKSKSYNANEFSFFDNPYAKMPKLTTFEEVYEFIKNPPQPYAQRIDNAISIAEQMNKQLDEGKKEEAKKTQKLYSESKRILPCFSYGLQMNGIHSLKNAVAASNVASLDIDDLNKDEMDGLAKKLREFDHVMAYFISPGQRGYKVFFKLDKSIVESFNKLIESGELEKLRREYYKLYASLDSWLLLNTTYKSDDNCKNVNRLCFYSRDKDIYYNPNAKPISKEFLDSENKDYLDEISPEIKNLASLQDIYDYATRSRPNMKRNRNNSLFLFAAFGFASGFSQNEIMSFARNAYTLDEKEMKDAISSAKKTDIAAGKGIYRRIFPGVRRQGKKKKNGTAGIMEDRPNLNDLSSGDILGIFDESYGFRINEIDGNLEVLFKDSETPEWHSGCNLVLNSLTSYIRDRVKGVRQREWLPYVCNFETPKHNPIIEILDGLPPYDGGEHIKKFCSYMKTDDDEHTYLQIRHYYASMVNTMINRQINQNMIIFVGPQGKGKTTIANSLLPKEFDRFVGQISPRMKDSKQKNIMFSTQAIVIIDEIVSFDALKEELNADITQKNLKDRTYFTENLADRKRLVSFIGTSNKSDLLRGEDGERRYTFIELLDAELDKIREFDKNLLLSEAIHMLENDYDVFKNPDTDEERAERNVKFTAASTLEELFIKCFKPCLDKEDANSGYYTPMFAGEISSAIHQDYRVSDKEVNAANVGILMKKLGVIRDDLGVTRKRHLVRKLGNMEYDKNFDKPFNN